MKAALIFLWRHRMETATVLQLLAANLITADLVKGTPMKWVVYANACLAGCIALFNKMAEMRAKRNQPLTDDTGDDPYLPGDPK